MKKVFYIIVMICVTFSIVEGVQRIRYALRFRSAYWFTYGFTEKPANFDAMFELGLHNKNSKVRIIEPPTIFYDGYRKNNPRYSSEIKINSHGFRGREIGKKMGYRIIALGGSTTFGFGVRDGFTYPELLEGMLNSADTKYEVINAGMIASDIKEISNLFKKEIVQLKPDLVLIDSVFNNFYYSKHLAQRNNVFQKANLFLMKKSLFYLTFREKMATLLYKHMGDLYSPPSQRLLYYFLQDNIFWEDMELRFNEIINIAKLNNIKIILIAEPIWLRNHRKSGCSLLLDERLGPIYNKFYTLLYLFSDRNGVEILNAANSFNSIPDKDAYFTDGIHLTPEGNKYLAYLIAKKFTTNRLYSKTQTH